jgi:hypothetical protein
MALTPFLLDLSMSQSLQGLDARGRARTDRHRHAQRREKALDNVRLDGLAALALELGKHGARDSSPGAQDFLGHPQDAVNVVQRISS